MHPELIAAIIMGAGLGANLVWMTTNLRIENRIGARIDALKDWMGERYVSLATWEGAEEIYAERHADVCRRLAALEKRA